MTAGGSQGPVLRPEPLTVAAFAPFGAVLAHDDRTDCDAEAAPALALYRLAPHFLPLPIRLFECHPGSCQVFAALTVECFLGVVAPAGPDGLPDPERAGAFLGERGAAIRYARDPWHAPMMALDAEGDMLMLAFERGTDGDATEHRLPAAVLVAD